MHCWRCRVTCANTQVGVIEFSAKKLSNGVFLVFFLCFDLYFVNYRSWQAEILQERAEGCIQVDLQKKIRQD